MTYRYIEHIIEPKRLLLSWQSGVTRLRHIVAELISNDKSVDLRYLIDTADYKNAVSDGFKGYPAYPVENGQIFRNVLGIFMRRLPPRSRKDFHIFLDSIRIKPDTVISDFALLGYSGGKLPDDDFFFVHPFENIDENFELLTMIQGFRHQDDAVKMIENNVLTIQSEVKLRCEPDNKVDPQAIAIYVENTKLGYIGRGLLSSFHSWINDNRIKSAFIERINGSTDHRKVYIFVSVDKK
jgi:hypothetical protein